MFTHSVRNFLGETLKRMIPGSWSHSFIQDGDEAFEEKLETAFKSVDHLNATRADYCKKVIGVLCDELSVIVKILRSSCSLCGYKEYSRRYLNTDRFLSLMLEADFAKLDKLKAVLQDPLKSHVRVLREIAAVLDDIDPSSIKCLDECEIDAVDAKFGKLAENVSASLKEAVSEAVKCRAAVENGIKAVNAHTDKTAAQIAEFVKDVGEKVDNLEEKVDNLQLPRKGERASKYAPETKRLCMALWTEERENVDLRFSLKTRVTFASVFERHRSAFEKVGVATVSVFKKVVKACQLSMRRAYFKKREALDDAARTALRTECKSAPAEPTTIMQKSTEIDTVNPLGGAVAALFALFVSFLAAASPNCGNMPDEEVKSEVPKVCGVDEPSPEGKQAECPSGDGEIWYNISNKKHRELLN